MKAALDVARTAIRAGATEVHMISLESFDEMPVMRTTQGRDLAAGVDLYSYKYDLTDYSAYKTVIMAEILLTTDYTDNTDWREDKGDGGDAFLTARMCSWARDRS